MGKEEGTVAPTTPISPAEQVMEQKGLDIVRRDWCPLCKDVGNYALKQILSGRPKEDVVADIHDHLRCEGEVWEGPGGRVDSCALGGCSPPISLTACASFSMLPSPSSLSGSLCSSSPVLSGWDYLFISHPHYFSHHPVLSPFPHPLSGASVSRWSPAPSRWASSSSPSS